MTPEQVDGVVSKYQALLTAKGYKPSRFDAKGCSPTQRDVLNHALWMCDEIPKLSSVEKKMRWLGFLQCALWAGQLTSIETMKDDNR